MLSFLQKEYVEIISEFYLTTFKVSLFLGTLSRDKKILEPRTKPLRANLTKLSLSKSAKRSRGTPIKEI